MQAQQRHHEARLFIRCQRQLLTAMHGNLVGQLDKLRVEPCRQIEQTGAFRKVVSHRLRRQLRHLQTGQQYGEFLQRGIEGKAARRHLVGNLQQGRRVAGQQGVEYGKQVVKIDGAEPVAHLYFLDLACPVGNGLIEQRKRIAHAATSRAREEIQGPGFGSDPFDFENVLEMRADQRRRHLFEIELQTARKYRHRDLLRIGGRQNEFHMLRRLFQRFQHGIEGRIREHVHFVDHIDLEAAPRRRIDGVFEQLTHFIDLGIGRRVNFQEIDKAPRIDLGAGRADATGGSGDAFFAVEGFGQNPRQRGLADTARAGKQVGMVQTLLRKRVRQRPDNVLLPDQTFKGFWPPFARQDLIAHGRILPWNDALRFTPRYVPPADVHARTRSVCADAGSSG